MGAFFATNLRRLAGQFIDHVNTFSHHFVNTRRDCSLMARRYVCGLMQATRKNMERMAEVVPDADEQSLQHFLTNSKWSERDVIDQVAVEADAILGGHEDSCLLIDESGFLKKGDKSVGVSRQWLGRHGKVDNGQVGVFAALASGKQVLPVDVRLYLPQEWCDDQDRCQAAGVPEKTAFRTKHELALDMVVHARRQRLRYGWIGFDGFYGESPWLLNSLDDLGETFVAEVHANQRVWLDDPKPRVPCRHSAKGREPTKPQVSEKSTEVRLLAASLPSDAWQLVKVRKGTKGTLRVQAASLTIWTWDGKETRARRRILVITRTPKGKDVKYALSNAPDSTPTEALAKMQRMRFWIERAFQDAKSESGMADYQVRKWQGWHHHMALVFVAMLFMLKVRNEAGKAIPLLSCSDIEVLLAHFLPSRNMTEDEVIRQMELRHRKRKAAIESACRKEATMEELECVTK